MAAGMRIALPFLLIGYSLVSTTTAIPAFDVFTNLGDSAPERVPIVWTATDSGTATQTPDATDGTITATATSPVTVGGPAVTQSSSTGGYMDVVDKWRDAGGLPSFSQDSTLEANALKTSTDSTNGLQHELNPGTLAQVLAPGTPDNFESVYVGGWLCEIPSLPGLDGICATEAQGWDHSDGDTGHAEILTSTKYSKIGCALAPNTGVWACDLA